MLDAHVVRPGVRPIWLLRVQPRTRDGAVAPSALEPQRDGGTQVKARAPCYR